MYCLPGGAEKLLGLHAVMNGVSFTRAAGDGGISVPGNVKALTDGERG